MNKFITFLNQFKQHNPLLVEAIESGYNVLHEDTDEWLTKYKLPSDNIRYSYIQQGINEPSSEKVDIKKLTDTWDGYDDLVFVETYNNYIIFYEGFVKSCWDSLFKKPEYVGLSKNDAVDKMVADRFTRIANDLDLTIDSYSFNGKILKIKFTTNDNSNLIEGTDLTLDDIFNDPLLDELDNPEIVDGGEVIAYHGTNAKFDKFDNSHIGTNFENTKDGYFFSSDMDYVTWLANKLSTENGGESIIYKCKLTLGKTFTLKNYFDTFDEDTATKMYGDTQGEVIDIFDSYRNDIISKAKYNKCDSVNFRSLGVNLYVVFDSNQIEMIEANTI